MGTYSPVPFLSDEKLNEMANAVLEPWLAGCAAEGIDFRGMLYPGIMLTDDGPKVLEFNARFGDPETQVYLPRLENDLVDLFEASIDGTLDQHELRWSEQSAVCVVNVVDPSLATIVVHASPRVAAIATTQKKIAISMRPRARARAGLPHHFKLGS